MRQPLEVIGVTGRSGPRRNAWQRAISDSGCCRLLLEVWQGHLGVAQVLPTRRLTDATIVAHADEADADEEDLGPADLMTVARQVFHEILEGTP